MKTVIKSIFVILLSGSFTISHSQPIGKLTSIFSPQQLEQMDLFPPAKAKTYRDSILQAFTDSLFPISEAQIEKIKVIQTGKLPGILDWGPMLKQSPFDLTPMQQDSVLKEQERIIAIFDRMNQFSPEAEKRNSEKLIMSKAKKAMLTYAPAYYREGPGVTPPIIEREFSYEPKNKKQQKKEWPKMNYRPISRVRFGYNSELEEYKHTKWAGNKKYTIPQLHPIYIDIWDDTRKIHAIQSPGGWGYSLNTDNDNRRIRPFDYNASVIREPKLKQAIYNQKLLETILENRKWRLNEKKENAQNKDTKPKSLPRDVYLTNHSPFELSPKRQQKILDRQNKIISCFQACSLRELPENERKQLLVALAKKTMLSYAPAYYRQGFKIPKPIIELYYDFSDQEYEYKVKFAYNPSQEHPYNFIRTKAQRYIQHVDISEKTGEVIRLRAVSKSRSLLNKRCLEMKPLQYDASIIKNEQLRNTIIRGMEQRNETTPKKSYWSTEPPVKLTVAQIDSCLSVEQATISRYHNAEIKDLNDSQRDSLLYALAGEAVLVYGPEYYHIGRQEKNSISYHIEVNRAMVFFDEQRISPLATTRVFIDLANKEVVWIRFGHDIIIDFAVKPDLERRRESNIIPIRFGKNRSTEVHKCPK
ncbi:MAG: hypothetical protein COC06_12435 [Bacteroidales bacterium]|nr:MAG: hypothetical protein COC06_12435 [Bacteroidales bacterium]